MKIDRRKDSLKSIKYIIKMSLITSGLLQVKNLLLAKHFAGDINLINYQLAFREVNMMAFLFSQAILMALVSSYRSIEEREGRESVLEFINNIFNIILLSMGLLVLISYISLSLNIFKMSNSYFLDLMKLGLPIVLLSSLKVVYTGFLQMKHGFFAGSRGNLARALIYVISLWTLGPKLSLRGLFILGVFASLIQLLIAYLGAKKSNYSYSFKIDLRNKHLKELLKAILYSLLILIVYRYASIYKDGNLLELLLVGVLFTAISTVIYPILSEEYERTVVNNRVDYGRFNQVFVESLVFILRIMIFIMMIFLFQSENIKEIFPYYRTRNYNLFLTSGLGLFAAAILPMIIRTFLSYREYMYGLITVGLGLIVSTLLNIILLRPELSYSIGLFTASLLGLSVINQDINYVQDINLQKKGNILFKTSVMSFLALLLIKLVEIGLRKFLVLDSLPVFIISSGLGLAVYIRVYKINEDRKYRKAD